MLNKLFNRLYADIDQCCAWVYHTHTHTILKVLTLLISSSKFHGHLVAYAAE